MNNIISYEKFYTDDTGKHIEDVFGGTNISIKSLWGNAVDAFFQYNFTNRVICLQGDIRVVFANDEGNNNYRFNQYFISGIDGKIINIPPETWFGINNLNSEKAILLFNHNLSQQVDEKRLTSKIFNWHLKR